MSKSTPPSAPGTPTTIQVVLTIPGATVFHHPPDPTATKKFIGTGELRVYSTVQDTKAPKDGSLPQTTFMALENHDAATDTRKNLIAHPLMPSSTAEKTADKVWRFQIPESGSLELQLLGASDAQIVALENLLADRTMYTNQHKLRNKLALVDDVGQVVGILDEDIEVDDSDNVSLSGDKSPVVVQAIEPQDDNDDKPLKLKITLPSADDMADYITSASQSFGAGMIRSATLVADGINSSSAYLSSKIPETQNPLTISPFIRKRIHNLTQVSRVTFSITNRIKTKVIQTAFDSGYRTIKYFTSKDDPNEYSAMQHFCYSILNSAGIIIQATEDSVGIISTPAINATQELAGRIAGPDAREIVTDALEGLKTLTLVYFDSAGVSRKAFLRTTRLAALQTAQEVKEGKIKMKARQKEPNEPIEVPIPFAGTARDAAATAKDAAGQVKKLYFKYFGKTDSDGATAEGSSSVVKSNI
ncbi:senescence-associated protein-domain-containing protein [Mortierella sp. GBAus27b]|nr:hypothetical protein BGX31_004047 [Mortierella sp. GBA43]KAI8351920.1 senescence-associated protein-domain-containing protein [Mortierella sp. GBAus27b]